MTKATLRKLASKQGHSLSRFTLRRYSDGRPMYHVAWCEKCDDSFFTDEGRQNPGVVTKCKPIR